MFERLFGGAPSPLVRAAFDDVSEMLRQSASMLELALGALLDNRPLEADLEAMDDPVDEGEQRVRRSVLEHLSFNPRQDLVASLILASMVQDAERLGDFARGLAELIPLARGPRGGPFADRLRQEGQRILGLFPLCEEAFREGDAEPARQVVGSHREIKAELAKITADVAASDLSADMAVVFAGAARALRRVSAHLSNIASTVVQPYDRIRHGDEEI